MSDIIMNEITITLQFTLFRYILSKNFMSL